MGIFQKLDAIAIKKLCEKIVEKAPVDEDYDNLKISSLKKAMELEEKAKDNFKENEKVDRKKEVLLELCDLAKKSKEHPYEVLKRNGYVKDPVEEFLKVQ